MILMISCIYTCQLFLDRILFIGSQIHNDRGLRAENNKQCVTAIQKLGVIDGIIDVYLTDNSKIIEFDNNQRVEHVGFDDSEGLIETKSDCIGGGIGGSVVGLV